MGHDDISAGLWFQIASEKIDKVTKDVEAALKRIDKGDDRHSDLRAEFIEWKMELKRLCDIGETIAAAIKLLEGGINDPTSGLIVNVRENTRFRENWEAGPDSLPALAKATIENSDWRQTQKKYLATVAVVLIGLIIKSLWSWVFSLIPFVK